MDRRQFMIATGAGLLAAGCSTGSAQPEVKKGRLIIDALGGISNPNIVTSGDPTAPRPPPEYIDPRALQDAKDSGVDAFNVTLGYVAGPMEPFEHSVKEIAWWDARIDANKRHLVKVKTAKDIELARTSGRLGVIYGFQNAAMMGDDAKRVEIFERLGVRIIQLTYNIANQIGDGSMATENRGLSEFGREVVAELNANNVLVDLSHSGEQTCLDALDTTTRPIAITHSGCRALADLPRNKTDEELRLLADQGGVVGIYFMPFLKVGTQPYAEEVVAHIEHAVNVCGEDHVGIGTDGPVTAIDDMPAYRALIREEIARRRAMGISATGETDDIVPFIPDLKGPDQFSKLAGMLSKRGFSEDRIDKIFGLNFFRLMDEIWGE